MSAISGASDRWVVSPFRRPMSDGETRLIAIGGAVLAASVAAYALGVSSAGTGIVTALLGVAPALVVALTGKPSPAIQPLLWIYFAVFAFVVFPDHLPYFLMSLPAALLFAWLESRRGLRRAALLATIRDVLWRVVGTTAAAVAALAAANRIERAVFDAEYGTPLEGLALFAGILAGGLLLIALIATVWWLPRAAARRMGAGRIVPSAAADALWLGVFLGAAAIDFDVRSMAVAGAFGDALGRASLIALAAIGAFAAARVGLQTVSESKLQDLWIVVLGDTRALRRHAAALAARWESGPVTVVASPALATRFGGVHLRLAQLRGEVEPLFPERAIHLADWKDTLPPAESWQGLPVRELYADSALWPEIFESKLEPNALVVVVAEGEPDEAVLDRLRALLPTSRTDFHILPSGKSAFDRWPGLEVYPIAGKGDAAIDGWIRTNATARDTAPGPRFVVIAFREEDRALAEAIRTALAHVRDVHGRIMVVELLLISKVWIERVIARYRVMSLPALGMKQVAVEARGRWWELLTAAFTRRAARSEFDVLVIKDADVSLVIQPGLLKAMTRMIGVLAGVSWVYDGIIRNGDAGEIARRLLALEFDSVEDERARSTAPPPSETHQPSPLSETPREMEKRLRVFFGFTIESNIAALQGGLSDMVDLHSYDRLDTDSLLDSLREFLIDADAVIIVIGPDGDDNLIGREIEVARSLRKPIFSILMAPMEMPFDLPAPVNMAAHGDLVDPSTPEGLEITLASLRRELDRLTSRSPRFQAK